jgi:hypothetical protein
MKMLHTYKLAFKGFQSDYRVMWRAAGRQAVSNDAARAVEKSSTRESPHTEADFLNFRDLGTASESLRKGALNAFDFP